MEEIKHNPGSENPAEETFAEFIQYQERIARIASQQSGDPSFFLREYQMLAEQYDKLLRTSIRMAKMSDRVQAKLMKFKDSVESGKIDL